MTAAAAVRRALHLSTTLASFPSTRTFVVGEDDVTAIEEADAGAYDVHIGPKLVRVPAHKVDHYEQDPRPGYGSDKRGQPRFVHVVGDGTFGCQTCGRVGFKSVHAVTVHYGIEHGDMR